MNTALLIKKYRLKNNMTQLQLGLKLGFKNSMFISLVEKQRSKVPSGRVREFCDVLNIPYGSLIAAMTRDYKDSLLKEMM